MVIKNKTARGTPFISNTAKETFSKKNAEQAADQIGQKPGTIIDQSQWVKNPSTMQPTLKLEMFAPKQEPQRPYGLYNQYIPTVEMPGAPRAFSNTAYQNLFLPTGAMTYGPNVRMPMQNVYNINLPGPTGGHVEMNKIYENILPGRDAKFTSTTLGERLQLYDYVRQILININDGEDISIDADGHKSLMSYIKFMELNPNYFNPIHTNPYRGLPFGLLIYRSCFPIKFDQASQTVVCAKNSIGLNIRLYSLSCAEYYSYKFRQLVYKEYDVWRELAYYEYVRENIIKKRQSPNFPVLYSFFLSPNRKIDFFALKKNCLTQRDLLSRDYQKFVEIHNLFSKVQPSSEIIRPMSLPDAARKVIAKLPDEIDPSLQGYSGTTLILVTEAPHHNIYQWASRIYEQEGIVNKMISHGYHDESVWLGILFQIVSALYVMQLHGIYIRDMTMQDNVYIKDLQNTGAHALGYWQYVINGVSYYVPNFGYLVLIDSNFKDIMPEARTLERCKREYKIYTHNIIGKNYSLTSIRQKVFENYRNIINKNAFGKDYTQSGVFRPPESIMKLIEAMMLDPETDLGKVIIKHFRPLMNNRIGTLLRKETEIPNIREITGKLAYGEIAVQLLEANIYKWCMVLESNSDGEVKIITRDSNNPANFIELPNVRVETLKQYNNAERIEQNIIPNVNFAESALLETYLISAPTNL